MNISLLLLFFVVAVVFVLLGIGVYISVTLGHFSSW